MRTAYQEWKPSADSLTIVAQAHQIATDYAGQGYNLTLRQLYYRFVATDAFPDDRRWTWTGSRWAKDPNGTKNAEPNYKWLGGLVNKGRLAGLLDWDHIEDRTRHLNELATWPEPAAILSQARDQYREDIWSDQPIAVEVWVEKDALIDVVGRAADAWDAPNFSCHGYVSQSAMWRAGQRIIRRLEEQGQTTIILHLGDHDPSGIDMTRDIHDRLHIFVMGDPATWQHARDALSADPEADTERAPYTLWEAQSDLPYPYTFEVRRIALTREQIEEEDPPPNPTKLSDSRAAGYIAKHGYESWELDALEPQTLNTLIEEHIEAIADLELMEAAKADQEANRQRISEAIDGLDIG